MHLFIFIITGISLNKKNRTKHIKFKQNRTQAIDQLKIIATTLNKNKKNPAKDDVK